MKIKNGGSQALVNLRRTYIGPEQPKNDKSKKEEGLRGILAFLWVSERGEAPKW